MKRHHFGPLRTAAWLATLVACLCTGLEPTAAAVPLDESPARPGEWGYRPADGTVSAVDPPAFSWRPQSNVASWELEVASDDEFTVVVYHADDITWNVHTPPQTLDAGRYCWRYRGRTADGEATQWSRSRSFEVPESAAEMPMPPREELLARIPQAHPRLFLRPEDLPELREAAEGPLSEIWQRIEARCQAALDDPPPTEEPPKYPPDVERKSERWREIWWGNRVYTIDALGTAATLGFAYQISGNREYGELAKRILLDCAEWAPHGATGYRYNDEAGMPYAYHFSRTYTFVHELLDESERDVCRRVMQARGEEMFQHLCPRHLWRPYSSHSNRAWHFLGEVGIAFHGEIPDADQWAWFAMNVFYNAYPVWCDDDGGWHEGASYWASYVSRFTWWADVMRAAFDIDAFDKPYFSQAGYYAMYLMPPHAVTGGFGDLACTRRARSNVPLVSVLAAQAQNQHWRWYVEAMGGPPRGNSFVDFIRGSLPELEPQPPDDLPSSRVFRGTGQAALNSTLLDARDNVQVLFKSSPFGLQSHGYDANNSFLLTAYNQRLFVSSGRRDIHGSDHHVQWMWSTRSVNNITVNGIGQLPHSPATKGEITAFVTTPEIDAVEGEAGDCYRDPESDDLLLDRFTRTVLFVKPELVIVYDRLVAKRPARFQYWLHSPEKMHLGDNRLQVQMGDVVCPVQFLAPSGLRMAQTDQYDPNPRPRVSIREWHLTAETPEPKRAVEFVTVYRPHKDGSDVGQGAALETVEGGYILRAATGDGEIIALLPTDDSTDLTVGNLRTQGDVVVRRTFDDGRPAETVLVEDVESRQ